MHQPNKTRLRHFALTLATATLAFTVTATQAAELVRNGSFESPIVTAEQGWMSYYGENAPEGYPEDFCPPGTPPELPECDAGETVPGWTVFWQDTLEQITPEPGRLEIQTDPIGGIVAADGNQKAELDGHYRDPDYDDDEEFNENVFLGQSVDTCARQPYVFSYSWKARQDVPGDNDILVLIDDEVVLTNTEFRDNWTREEYKFLASPTGVSLLGFTSVGISNTLGMLIDNVSIIGADPSVEGACDLPPLCPNPNTLTLLYDGDFSGDDFPADGDGQTNKPGAVVSDFGELQNWVQVQVFDADLGDQLYAGTIRIGQTFTFPGANGARVPDLLFIELSDQQGTLLQEITLPTGDLNVGEEYGGIGIWDANCECDCVCEDDSKARNIDFRGLTENQTFDGDTFAGFGVRFSGARTTRPLMIQDTSDPTLPGSSQDHFNPVQGKALTFSRFADPAGRPNELAGRQQFNIDFDHPVVLKSITTMDNEEDGSEIRVYGEAGLIKTVPVPVTPDGTGNWEASLQVVKINAEGVTRVEFDSLGSTFIDDIAYHIPCGETCDCDCGAPGDPR